MEVPERLARKIDLFRATGVLVNEKLDIFQDASWLQVMVGQGIMPRDYHPIADTLTDAQLADKLEKTRQTKMQPLDRIPAHDEFLEKFCKAG
jgi:tryptophan halogenase